MVKAGEKMVEQCGTPAYIAPEILRGRGYEGFAVDVWSAGVVLYAMVYGTVPFRAGSMKELHRMIVKGDYTLKEDVSEEVRDLLGKMLEVDVRKRCTIPKILCHPWFADYDPSISLFTKEEKENIEKEFTYSKKPNRNQGLDNGNVTIESDWFIEQNIDLTHNELTKNITSKSVILAPFNSTITNEEEKKDYEVPESEVKNKKLVKLNSKVKEIDRQYERNNNCEVDNGVYNKYTATKELTKKDKNDLNPLGSSEGSFDDPHFPETRPNVISKKTFTPIHTGAIKNSLLNCLAPKPLVINREAVRRVVELGYPEDYVIEGLEKSLKNYATTTYLLLAP